MRIDFEWPDDDPKVIALMYHFKEAGRPYASPSHMFKDMVDDVIDVWLDDHFKDDDGCNLEEEPDHEGPAGDYVTDYWFTSGGPDQQPHEDEDLAASIQREMAIDRDEGRA